MTLKAKFGLFATILVVIVITGVSAFFLIFEAQYLDKKGREGQKEMARDAAKLCGQSIIINDDMMMYNYFNSVKQTVGVLYLMFVQPNGEVRMHSDMQFVGHTFKDEAAKKAIGSEKLLVQLYYDQDGEKISEVSMPVLDGEHRLGTVRIGFSEGVLRRSVKQSMASTTEGQVWR